MACGLGEGFRTFGGSVVGCTGNPVGPVRISLLRCLGDLLSDGFEMVGAPDGDMVGSEVVGARDGEVEGPEMDGEAVGSEVVGDINGVMVGSAVVDDIQSG